MFLVMSQPAPVYSPMNLGTMGPPGLQYLASLGTFTYILASLGTFTYIVASLETFTYILVSLCTFPYI